MRTYIRYTILILILILNFVITTLIVFESRPTSFRLPFFGFLLFVSLTRAV